MSWRAFQTRVLGLSAESRFAHEVANSTPTTSGGRAERVIDDDAQIDALIAAYGA